MAASDQMYREQKRLDIFFGVSCILMLLSTIWMFVQDFNREYKTEQRIFRDVEEAMAQRGMLNNLPNETERAKIQAAQDKLAAALKDRNAKEKELKGRVDELMPKKVQGENRAQAIKADFDSINSLYNIEIDKLNKSKPDTEEHKVLKARVDDFFKQIKTLAEMAKAQLVVVEENERTLNQIRADEKEFVENATTAERELKELMKEFDLYAKLAAQKRWSWKDTLRSMPVLDAFASPIRIQQYTLEDLPIDYNFKYVTRFDRCTTCHQGLEKATYTKEALRQLTEPVTEQQKAHFAAAKKLLEQRNKTLSMLEFAYGPGDLNLDRVSNSKMNEYRVNEFCAHPRTDLFVDPKSPHAAEKFGCTICHGGQGSATDFMWASHTPNSVAQGKNWTKDLGWHSNHFWEFPMQPARFLEASCVKCHHQMTDLQPDGNKIEKRATKEVDTPGSKVLRGYNIVRDQGCFGCHEIAGIKGGRSVGPDMRLEPSPPLSDLTPEQRAEALKDPLNPPGSMRKVGPSLNRLSEKTNEEWAVRWIYDPRGFRPDTKMPHFYHLSNNTKQALEGTGQEEFPHAEVRSIAHYLFRASDQYVTKHGKLADLKLPEGYKEDETRGRKLFTEKGCLACHTNENTTKPMQGVPAMTSEAHFGPNLTRIAAKLGSKPGDKESARRWLVHWVKNPWFHNPRTYMPITHLDDAEASDIAAWLLAQPVTDWPKDPERPRPPADKGYENLARVYLNKAFSKYEVTEIFKDPSAEKLKKIIDKEDEAATRDLDYEGKLKFYVGKKSVNQLGCFGCHEIPGFEKAKPVGTPLNDWGKKDPERLAFESISAFVKGHYHLVDSKVDKNGNGFPIENGKEPYEKFFFKTLESHPPQRDGFLHQKLREPRSFDYDRLRAWDERLRMPQFQFNRDKVKPRDGESLETATLREEAEAREAVMTFILGLVAEPIPLKFLHQPKSDALAVAKGKQVIEKFNCAGCHQTQPGRYEFKRNTDTLGKMEECLEKVQRLADSDHKDFLVNPLLHDAWTAPPPKSSDRLTAIGNGKPSLLEPGFLGVYLTDALRYDTDKQKVLPAGSMLSLPPADVVAQTAPEGGAFADLLVGYLAKVDAAYYKLDASGDSTNGRAASPPPLLREGEKTQPEWLFRFLRDPTKIRPVTVLRMPKFNMSDEDAMALVNYFAAVDRLQHPAQGLTYPYLTVPQREESYWIGKNAEYIARLKKEKDGDKSKYDTRLQQMQPVWEWVIQEKVKDVEAKIKSTEEALPRTAPEDKPAAQNFLDGLKRQLGPLKEEAGRKDPNSPFFKEQKQRWEEKEAYAIDAYRLVASYSTPCLSCHQLGSLPAQQALGPPLDPAYERLRPEWTFRWLANPERMISYPTPMPMNFSAKKTPYPEFAGTNLQQAQAVRDVLLNWPAVSSLPANKKP